MLVLVVIALPVEDELGARLQAGLTDDVTDTTVWVGPVKVTDQSKSVILRG